MLRWFKRLAAFGIAALIVLLFVGATWEQWERWRAPKRFPPPGELHDVGGHRLHLQCTGSGEPTVILESGAGTLGSLPWHRTASLLDGLTRVCRYDRAGFQWSEVGPPPRDAHHIADELHALLEAGGVSPPYVMVGHSIGGILIRVYDLRYPGEVAGFVFVESAHPDQDRRAPPEMKARAGGSPPMGLFALLARIGALRLSARMSAPKRELTSTERGVLAYAPRSMLASMAEYAARDSVVAQGRRAGTLDPRPIIVLTAGLPDQEAPPGISGEVFAQFRALRMELQAEIASLSSNSDHRLVPESGHVLQMDDPDAAATAIRDVVTAVRTGGTVGGKDGR